MEEKCLHLSVRIYNLTRFLNEEKQEYRIADQLFRSGTSIGANMSEAQCAISHNDFIAKIYISLKECNETLYRLRLLYTTRLLVRDRFESIYADCEELKKLLTAITKTAKNKQP